MKTDFFRKDLNLKNRWWHRLLFIIFIFSFLGISGYIIIDMLNSAEFPRYKKVELLSDRMDLELRLLSDLVKPEEKIAVYEHNLYGYYGGKLFYDAWGGWLLKQKIYCSKNIASHIEEIEMIEKPGLIEKITKKTDINYEYRGNLGLVSLQDFKTYLSENNAHCIEVIDLFDLENSKALSWALEAENEIVWEKSIIKSILYLLTGISIVIIGFFILVILYYKVFLYIVFGRQKPYDKR